MRPVYATREQLARSPEVKSSALASDQLDRALSDGSDSVDRMLRRRFYPWQGTRTLKVLGGRAYAGEIDIISVSSVAADGTDLTVDQWSLKGSSDGQAPFGWIELEDASGIELTVTGVWGWPPDTTAVSTLSGSLSSSVTTLTMATSGGASGVGSILAVDSEWMIVTDRSWSDSGADLGAGMAQAVNITQATFSSTTGFSRGEMIIIGSEKMMITDVLSSTVALVRRAWDGSVLAAHSSGDSIFVPRALTVSRGTLGTSAATHSSGATVSTLTPPPGIATLTIAEAIVTVQQELAAYARSIGSESPLETRAPGLADKRKKAFDTYGRKVRYAAIGAIPWLP